MTEATSEMALRTEADVRLRAGRITETQARAIGQYAIDSGAEGLGHCPRGKCVMSEGAHEVEPSCKTPAGCAENGCLGWCDAHRPESAAVPSSKTPNARANRTDTAR